MDFVVTADHEKIKVHKIKIKESKKTDKCLNFANDLKSCKFMKLMVRPILAGAPGAVPKNLEKRQEEVRN